MELEFNGELYLLLDSVLGNLVHLIQHFATSGAGTNTGNIAVTGPGCSGQWCSWAQLGVESQLAISAQVSVSESINSLYWWNINKRFCSNSGPTQALLQRLVLRQLQLQYKQARLT